jgi:tRNA (adenine57-N1/adenine58-N1)-methyltransferase
VGESLAPGENVLLVDSKNRRYLLRLTDGGSFHTHQGIVTHAEIAAAGDGGTVTTSGGATLTVLRPRYADYVLKMPRGAQVVYPKDIGPILVWADIAPGLTVLEAGTGSGALTIALVRAVGPAGRVISVERRPDHHEVAMRSLVRWFGEVPANLELRTGEVEEVVAEVRPDRLVLDLPEPWHAVGVAAATMSGGALICAYLPTIPQVQTMVETMRATSRWSEIEVFETFHRTWNVSGRSVRPDHRMVGHTGFVVVGRRVDPAGGDREDGPDREEGPAHAGPSVDHD